MRLVTREFQIQPTDHIRIYPIGDVHVGAVGCREDLLEAKVQQVAADPQGWWVGVGDYCEFINMKDPRFSPTALAAWIETWMLEDLAQAQIDRLLRFIRPIRHKCLALLMGNHEAAIAKHSEHNVYRAIGKELWGEQLMEQYMLGYSGWLRLLFQGVGVGVGNAPMAQLRVALHHGYTNGKLSGAKALDMQRWLWNHSCDLTIFGHSHNTMAQVEAVEHIQEDGVNKEVRTGLYGGTFLDWSFYAEMRGYPPQPTVQSHAILRPGAEHPLWRVSAVVPG